VVAVSFSAVSETVAKRYNIPVGIYIEDVTKDGPGDKAGLTSGDIITKINGVEVTTTTELNKEKNKCSIGDKITLTVYSNNNYKDVTVTLGEEEETEATGTTTTQNSSSNSSTQVPSNPYSSGSNSGSIFDFFN
jgi:serine protease Do